MPLIRCASCGQPNTVQNAWAHQESRCQNCGKVIPVSQTAVPGRGTPSDYSTLALPRQETPAGSIAPWQDSSTQPSMPLDTNAQVPVLKQAPPDAEPTTQCAPPAPAAVMMNVR